MNCTHKVCVRGRRRGMNPPSGNWDTQYSGLLSSGTASLQHLTLGTLYSLFAWVHHAHTVKRDFILSSKTLPEDCSAERRKKDYCTGTYIPANVLNVSTPFWLNSMFWTGNDHENSGQVRAVQKQSWFYLVSDLCGTFERQAVTEIRRGFERFLLESSKWFVHLVFCLITNEVIAACEWMCC